MLVILPNPIPEFQHALYPSKCCEPKSMPQFLVLPLFSLQIHIWNLSRSQRARHHPCFFYLRHFTFILHYLMLIIRNTFSHILICMLEKKKNSQLSNIASMHHPSVLGLGVCTKVKKSKTHLFAPPSSSIKCLIKNYTKLK